jgi:hypothetical protein
MSLSLVSTVTVGAGGAASIDFTSIAGTATDLVILLSGRSLATYAGDLFDLKVNGSSTGYTYRNLRGNGSSAASGNGGTATYIRGYAVPGNTATANTFGNVAITIPNYSGSIAKSFSFDGVGEDNASSADAGIVAGGWSETSAITSIALTAAGGNWAQYSTASLYTITKGSGGATTSP